MPITSKYCIKAWVQGRVTWNITGAHNRMNALAAIAAARHVGVAPATAIEALSQFVNVKRRMEVRGEEVNGVRVIDDFAHHPDGDSNDPEGLRRSVGSRRILAVLEPRSNTMKMGAIKRLPASLAAADLVFVYGALQRQRCAGLGIWLKPLPLWAIRSALITTLRLWSPKLCRHPALAIVF